MHACTYMWIKYTCVHMYDRVYACMHVCAVCIYVCAWSVYPCVYACKHNECILVYTLSLYMDGKTY